jgi:hypothetical protein
MPRFVVLSHDHPVLHWDLMLEQGDALRTWRLARFPDTVEPIDAEQLPDHRTAYLDYEGPISGGRGTVKRWDAGSYEPVNEDAGNEGAREGAPDRVVVRFAGAKLAGVASLTRTSGERWIFKLLVPPDPAT